MDTTDITAADLTPAERDYADRVRHPVHRHSAAGQALISRAKDYERAADKAFSRMMAGQGNTSAASRMRNRSDEAWADVRLQVKLGELIEAQWSEKDILRVEAADLANRLPEYGVKAIGNLSQEDLELLGHIVLNELNERETR